MGEIKLKLKTPRVPNFIMIEMPEGQPEASIPIKDLTQEQIDSISSEWKKELEAKVERAKKLNAI